MSQWENFSKNVIQYEQTTRKKNKICFIKKKNFSNKKILKDGVVQACQKKN
jgi:hypothetical protein